MEGSLLGAIPKKKTWTAKCQISAPAAAAAVERRYQPGK